MASGTRKAAPPHWRRERRPRSHPALRHAARDSLCPKNRAEDSQSAPRNPAQADFLLRLAQGRLGGTFAGFPRARRGRPPARHGWRGARALVSTMERPCAPPHHRTSTAAGLAFAQNSGSGGMLAILWQPNCSQSCSGLSGAGKSLSAPGCGRVPPRGIRAAGCREGTGKAKSAITCLDPEKPHPGRENPPRQSEAQAPRHAPPAFRRSAARPHGGESPEVTPHMDIRLETATRCKVSRTGCSSPATTISSRLVRKARARPSGPSVPRVPPQGTAHHPRGFPRAPPG